MILSIQCYIPPFVEPLGPTTPSFKLGIPTHQFSNKIDASGRTQSNLKEQTCIFNAAYWLYWYQSNEKSF